MSNGGNRKPAYPDNVLLSWLLPLLFLIAGVGLLVGAVVNAKRTRSFLSRAMETSGTVVALEQERGHEAGDPQTLRSVVSFQVAGQAIRFKSTMSSYPATHAVGAAVGVLYDRERPSEARIRSFATLWLLAIILAALGLLFAGVGAGLLLWGVPA